MVNVGGVMLDPVELRDALQWLGWQVRPVRKRRWGQWVTPLSPWSARTPNGSSARLTGSMRRRYGRSSPA